MDNTIEDTYKTIEKDSLGEYKDRGSKFISYLFQCNDIAVFESHLASIKKEHLKARHHCYAYRLGMSGDLFRSNDDGEPSGTAGKPILGQIDKHGLINVACVVVRYFGGTKLGTSGLISAYKGAAIDAITNGIIVQKTLEDRIKISFPYSVMGPLLSAVKKNSISISEKDFGEHPSIILTIRKSMTVTGLERLYSTFLSKSIEEVRQLENIPDLEVEILYNG